MYACVKAYDIRLLRWLDERTLYFAISPFVNENFTSTISELMRCSSTSVSLKLVLWTKRLETC